MRTLSLKTICFSVCFFVITSAFSQGGTISGTVRYTNADSTILSYSKVILWDDMSNKIDSTYANSNGYFEFLGLISGNYHVTARPTHPWGGVNSADALLTLKHFTHIVTLAGLNLLAANVNGQQGVNSSDALLIQKRFTTIITAFIIDDWISENKTVTIISNESHNITLYTICTGDVNGSYTPNNNGLGCPGIPTFVYGGQTYNTVQIGTQCWMRENLNIGTMVNGTSSQTNNGTIEKYCYNNDVNNCNIYGGLYQWNEMMQYVTTQGTQGICPSGWHVPTDAEFCTLTVFIDPTVNCALDNASTGTDGGTKMKEEGGAHWLTPNIANNASGFTALGGNFRDNNGSFYTPFKHNAMFFTSTQHSNTDYAWRRSFSYSSWAVGRYIYNKTAGYSVRCIKN